LHGYGINSLGPRFTINVQNVSTCENEYMSLILRISSVRVRYSGGTNGNNALDKFIDFDTLLVKL